MELHADLSQPVVLDTNRLPWSPSPVDGVERRLLERLGDEVARATSIVRYAPASVEGCTLLVKLHQMHPADQERRVVSTASAPWRPGLVPGLAVLPLHSFGSEQVALVRWQPGTRFSAHRHPGGEEILVLSGVFQDENGTYPTGSWLRHPPGSLHQPCSEAGCTIWVKTGHLPATVGPSGSSN